ELNAVLSELSNHREAKTASSSLVASLRLAEDIAAIMERVQVEDRLCAHADLARRFWKEVRDPETAKRLHEIDRIGRPLWRSDLRVASSYLNFQRLFALG